MNERNVAYKWAAAALDYGKDMPYEMQRECHFETNGKRKTEDDCVTYYGQNGELD
jgi:hypothetical protein